MTSPASGAAELLPGLVSDRRPPVALAMPVLRRDVRNQILQAITAPLPWLGERHSDYQGAVFDGQFGAFTCGRSDLPGKGARNPHGEAVAPLLELDFHDLMAGIYRFYNVDTWGCAPGSQGGSSRVPRTPDDAFTQSGEQTRREERRLLPGL